MNIARQIMAVVENVRLACETATGNDAALPSALIEPFDNLEKYDILSMAIRRVLTRLWMHCEGS